MDDQHDESNFDGGATGEDAELYLLKWNSHQNHFANKFSELLDEDDISFADVTLACEGNFLQAHRLVLAVCSPFFKNLFKVNCAEKGPATIVLANVRYTDLENILHFIYRGQVNVRKEDLNKFLETGEQLQIDGLMGQGQNSQSKQNSFKRRYSEGGHVLPRTNHNHHNNQNTYVGNRNRTAVQSQVNYRVIPGHISRVVSSASGSASHLHTSQSGHIDASVKKPRISPPSASSTTPATVGKQESVVVNPSPTRRPSTSSSTSSHHNNNTTPPTSNQTLRKEKADEGGSEIIENNGIKILSVGSITASVPASVDYDAEGNEVFEILDYDEDDDRPDHENEMEMQDDATPYGDGTDEGDGVYYTYQSTFSRTSTSSQPSGQQARLGSAIQARYPSIIDGVHFDLISADEKKVAAQCKLCPGDKVIRGSGLTSSNFISHLRAFHKRELEEWREKRKTETRRRLD